MKMYPHNTKCASVFLPEKLSQRGIILLILLGFTVVLISRCSHSNNVRREISRTTLQREQLRKERAPARSLDSFQGTASFYGAKFHGRKTASGEIFDMNKLTAAHRTLPFGTICRVTNLLNKKSVIVRINDRGPFVPGRLLDLSRGAAQALDAIPQGIIRVKVEVLRYPDD